MNAYDQLGNFRIDANGFVFDASRGIFYSLNETAMWVVELFRKGCREQDLPGRLAEEYNVPHSLAQRDVENLLAALRGYRLL